MRAHNRGGLVAPHVSGIAPGEKRRICFDAGTRRAARLWYQEKRRHKKAPPKWGLPGGQRAGNSPGPHSVNKLGSKHKGDEGVVNKKSDERPDGEGGDYQGPPDHRNKDVIDLVFDLFFGHNVFPLGR